MKRLILPPEGTDSSHEHTSHLSDDVTMPTLTIRYPPVFDDDVACQQYQYLSGDPRRPDYRHSLYQTDRGPGPFHCENPQRYGHSVWQDCPRADDYANDPYEQAVDFSMTRSTSQEPEERHLTHPSLTLSTRFRTATSTPCRLPQEGLLDFSGHLYSDRPTPLPYVPQDETDTMYPLPQRSAVSSVHQRLNVVGAVPETLLQQCEGSADHRDVPVELRGGFGYESPAVQRCQEQQQERLVYFDMDTPQREQPEIREEVTPQFKIKEEACDVPLQMRHLLP